MAGRIKVAVSQARRNVLKIGVWRRRRSAGGRWCTCKKERSREALQCLETAHRLFGELSARRELLDRDRRLDGLENTYLRVVAAWGESIEGRSSHGRTLRAGSRTRPACLPRR